VEKSLNEYKFLIACGVAGNPSFASSHAGIINNVVTDTIIIASIIIITGSFLSIFPLHSL